MSENQRDLARALYPQLARIGKALSSPTRLELFDLLRQGPRSVESLAEQAGITLANTSQHLQHLRAARLVEGEKQGQHVIYRVASEDACRFFCALRGLAESRLTEVKHLWHEFFAGEEQELGPEELLRQVRSGKATVVDVRPQEEYRAGHLPGSLSIPLGELPRRLGELPRERDIIVYCRGRYCLMAVEAVRLLRGKGLRAHRLELGVVELRALDWRIERSDGPVGPEPTPPKRRATRRTRTRSVSSQSSRRHS